MIHIVCVGNLKEKYLEDAASEYIKRIKKFDKVEIVEIKESILSPFNLALAEEAKEINKKLKGFVIKMDIKGNELDSVGFAKKIENIKLNGNSDITFVIGSSNGLDKSIPSNYNMSFSPMTFPHQLARIMLLEQIYRAFSILNNTPYHK